MKSSSNIVLLDCTLRDGGYNNDWEFGKNTITSVFERIVSSEIDFLEVGFLDQTRCFDPNRTIAPDTDSMGHIYGKLDRKHTRLVGMIDFGKCDLSNIRPQSESCLDGIRVIFKKHLRVGAMAFCNELKKKGYLVFAQLVSITSYSDEELLDLVRLVNDVKPFAVSIVDTYGLLHKSGLFHYYEMLDEHLDSTIAIGYHSHNNFQLGYANSIELINRHRGSERTLLCDGSLFGMGKGAGNAPIELLATFVNDTFGHRYDIGQLLEAIDSCISPLYSKYHWGYSLKAFIAASNDCHPNYVSFLLNKKTLSVKSVNAILKNLEGERKLLYDQATIEKLYVDYQKNACSDDRVYPELENLVSGKSVLVLGPGASINNDKGRIRQLIERQKPFVLALNYIPDELPADALFLTNAKRYNQQISAITERKGAIKLIATSNLSRTDGKFDYTLDYESLIDRSAVFPDNSFLMTLKVLKTIGVGEILLAGFDGYSQAAPLYCSSQMEYEFARRMGEEINAQVNAALSKLQQTMKLNFITPTVYRHS